MENLEKELKVVQEMKAVTEGAFENADCDYPAAHSMDTTWFAVDKDGYVALMETNEEGALPFACDDEQSDGSEFLEDLTTHTGRELELGDFEFPRPESVGLFGYASELDSFPPVCELDQETLEKLQMRDGLPTPYSRTAVPEQPLHIEDLPPNLQKQLKLLVFSDVSFAADEWVQPAMHVPCQMWGEGDIQVLDVDGRIKHIPEDLKADYGRRKQVLAKEPSSQVRNLPWWKKLFQD